MEKWRNVAYINASVAVSCWRYSYKYGYGAHSTRWRTAGWRPMIETKIFRRRSQWPRVLMRGSGVVCLLGLRFRIPPRSWVICVLWVLCVVTYKSLRRADHSSRRFFPTVVCLSVIRSNNNPLLLQWVGRGSQIKKCSVSIYLAFS